MSSKDLKIRFDNQFCRMNCQLFSWPLSSGARGGSCKSEMLFGTAIARDDRPWGGTDPPAVAYTYAPGRGGEHLEKLPANYPGIGQCDGYAPYKKPAAGRVT